MRKIFTTLGATFILSFLIVASSQENSGSTGVQVQVAEHATLGQYLTDVEGRSLYLFLTDRLGGEIESKCFDECAENWPPFSLEVVPIPEGTAGEGVDASLLDFLERETESPQATYNDWPLYYFAGDEQPGDTNGQGVGEVWFLVSPEGEPLEAGEREENSATQSGGGGGQPNTQSGGAGEGAQEDDTQAGGGGDSEELAQLMSEGETVFTGTASPPCASCHGDNGEGGAGPGLVGSRTAERNNSIVGLLIHGGHIMPAFGDQLSDRQIAAVATYVRNSWGNDFGVITEEEVSAAR